jgi:nicotinate dehydrogenase subunit B
VREIPGLVAVVRIGDFVGVVAEREEKRDQGRRSAQGELETDPDDCRI